MTPAANHGGPVLLVYLLLLFTVLPLVELTLLVWLGGEICWLQTFALVLLTGFVGAALARAQGLATLWRVQRELSEGRMPGDALFDGALILVAGAVLITPGVLTDAVGFSLLIPPLRSVAKRLLRRWFAHHFRFEAAGFTTPPPDRSTSDTVIDVEVIETRVEDPR